MKRNSRSCWDASKLVAAALAFGLAGCLPETWQRKFIRKPKAQGRPTPIVQFQDYTRAMTPLDRYRKHYAIFDYWNADLLAGLEARDANPKALRQASAEALSELRTLRSLLQEDIAAQLDPMIDARGRLDQQLRRGSATPSQLGQMHRTLDTQTRQIHRTLFWRDVQDTLKAEVSHQTGP